MRARIFGAIVATSAGLVASAMAQPAPSAAPAAAPSAAPAPGCIESLPTGARRPDVIETFPLRGMSGHAATLVVRVNHGKGETVMPRGLEIRADSPAAKELVAAGFALPDPSGSGAPHLAPDEDAGTAERATTVLELPVVPLPKEPGRAHLVLPPLPIAVARASGDLMTLCTRPHSILVEDPTSSTPEAEPKANPAPLVQREEWSALKEALKWIGLGAVVGGILAYFLYRWWKRPRPVPPPPPPRPPWEVALERLDEVRHAGLLEQGRFAEYFDRVNDTVRVYLGARFGFDGLESTTAETVKALERAHPQGVAIAEIIAFLQDCDLVKFANLTPSPADCGRVLSAGESIVRATSPRVRAYAEGVAAS